MKPVYIAGAGMTRFGRSEWPLIKLAGVASLEALRHAKLGEIPVDSVVVANMGAARVNMQTALGSALVDQLSLCPATAEAVENGPASGASAVKVGFQAVASGMADVVLVTGVEQMRAVNGLEGTDFVASLSQPEVEYIYGVTLPSLHTPTNSTLKSSPAGQWGSPLEVLLSRGAPFAVAFTAR